eukprot:917468_1
MKHERSIGSARELFDASNFPEAIKCLTKFKKERSKDASFVHNLLVSKFLASRHENPQETLSYLDSLLMKSSVSSQGGSRKDSSVSIDTSIVKFNQAAVMFCLARNNEACTILEGLRPKVAQNRSLSVKVCFLLLEIYVQEGHTSGAMSIIEYLTEYDSPTKSNKFMSHRPGGDPKDRSAFNRLSFFYNSARSRIALADGNFSKARTILKDFVQLISKSDIQPSDMICARFLKSYIELRKGNSKKALKVLISGADDCQVNSRVSCAFFNNLGCVHLQIGKHGLAEFYFSKAVSCCNREESTSTSPKIYVPEMNRLCALYNCGLSLLSNENPKFAFGCFRECVAAMSNRPTLWTRMAQCCLQIHLEKRRSSPADQNQFTRTEIRDPRGFGGNRWIILPMKERRSLGATCPSNDDLSLEAAATYLQNALLLLESSESISSRDSKIKQVVLLNIAYISLCIDDIKSALQHSKMLLDMGDTVSSNNTYLAHMYAAEALCSMNRPQDALSHLHPSLFPGFIYLGDESTSQQSVSSPDILTLKGKSPKNV